MTTYWAPLLHIYQPPFQELEILKKINEECYNPLFRIIEGYDSAKFCLNINGILIEFLEKFGLTDSLDLLKNLVAANKIEILGTAKFHPILPLFPKKEVKHQIQMNEEINRRTFGNNWQRGGFFPPELAISSQILKIIKELNYKWVLVSGIALPWENDENNWPYDRIYRSPNDLQMYFRDDILSNKISFKNITAKSFVKDLKTLHRSTKENNNNDTYLITAMDGETFGHHIKKFEKIFLAKTIELIEKDEDLEIKFISELDTLFPVGDKPMIPKSSSWSTNYKDLKDNVPYPLWYHPRNEVHKYYWKIMKSLNNLMNLADNLDLTENWSIENHYKTARWFYDQAICSDTTWWANPLSNLWSPNLIYKGLELLMRAALNAQMALVYAGEENGDGYFDSISYYHGLLLMELYSTTKKSMKK